MNVALNNKFHCLRERAEKLLQNSENALQEKDLKNLKEMAHELIVYQTEFELQNDELRKTHLELQQTKDRFVELFENAPVGYVILNSSGMILQTNAKWQAMLELNEKEFKGSLFTDNILEADRSIFLSRFKNFFNNPVDKKIILRLKKAQEKFFYAQIEATVRYENTEDAAPQKSLLITVSDISEIKEAQFKLAKALNFLKLTINQIPVPVIIASAPDMKLTHFNQGALDLMNAFPGNIHNIALEEFKNYWPLHHANGTSCVLEDLPIKKAIANREVTSNQEFILPIEKGERWVSISAAPLIDDDGFVIAGIMAFPDITEKKLLEKKLIQSEKMESIGNLAGGIAHHFNNILSSILGFSEIALGSVEEGSDLENDLKEIHTAGKRARDLVLQILSFARQDNEEVRPVSIANVVKESIKLLQSTIPADIEIQQSISTTAMVLGNPALLQQVILNLSSNAADAMEENGGTLSIRLTDQPVDTIFAAENELSGPGSYVELTITDTGTGIAPNIIKAIFEPYFTTKETGKGTGMGLASAYGIVKKYGGNIYVESRLKQGSVFKVLLPSVQKDRVHDTSGSCDTQAQSTTKVERSVSVTQTFL